MFYLFIGSDYYPEGGANDLQAMGDTLEGVKEQIPSGYDWWHIMDENTEIVEEGRG